MLRKRLQGGQRSFRLFVFRSLNHIYAEIIDEKKNKTVASASDRNLKKTKKDSKVKLAYEVGKKIAELGKEKKITKVFFDRGGYKYHGRVKSLADGAREGGLEF